MTDEVFKLLLEYRKQMEFKIRQIVLSGIHPKDIQIVELPQKLGSTVIKHEIKWDSNITYNSYSEQHKRELEILRILINADAPYDQFKEELERIGYGKND